jgi:ubiquinone/menaquinone biosynthesis C-methylase UbiE
MSLKKDVTEKIRNRYSRISLFYDLMELPLERIAFSRWRKKIFSFLESDDILEVGVGTGKNFDFYPVGKPITAIDFSPGMLSRAKKKAERKGIRVNLLDMDVQNLKFGDQSFDTVLATFVFCSVPDPIEGLKEMKRVCKNGGKIILLEHVRPSSKLLGNLFDTLNPFIVRLMGVNINRETVANLEQAGLKIEEERNLFNDIVKIVVATPSTAEDFMP